MDVSKGDFVVIADVSYILSKEFRTDIKLGLKIKLQYKTIIQSQLHLMRSSIQEVRTRFPVRGEKYALDMLKEWPCSWETAWLLVFFRHLLS